jgi:purine-nucleoside phosphorylase
MARPAAAELVQRIRTASEVIRSRSDLKPRAAVILGTGLGALAEEIDADASIPYEEIPDFPVSTVESHSGRLLLGHLSGQPVVAMQGRFHRYEGYTLPQVAFPVRVMRDLGAEMLIVSNACGGMNPMWDVGDLMLIADHINLLGDNPLIGPNSEELGPRFPDMSEPYDEGLQRLALDVARDEKITLRRGVYVAVSGPNLETRAEYRFLRMIGADVVGMSTVPEVIVALHGGMKVLGVSIITDSCLPDALKPASVEEIIQVAGAAEPKLTLLIKEVVARLGPQQI